MTPAAWRHRLDPELAPALALIAEPDLSDPARARALFDEMAQQVQVAVPGIEKLAITDHLVGEGGGAPPVPVRVYRPPASGLLPGLVWIHGGGFVVGSVAVEHAGTAAVALEAEVVVVSVEYRLAPEHPFPAGLDDCWAALAWVGAEAPSLGIDPERLGVGGLSAGGGLSAALALRSRDEAGPTLAFQLLGIPELDDRLDTPSMREFTDTPLWNAHLAEVSWTYYLGQDVEARRDAEISPYAAPARATTLAGLPPAYLCTSELDPLRDEGIDYARRLMQAGVPVELHHFPGTFHGSTLVTEAAVSKRMHAELVGALRRGLRS